MESHRVDSIISGRSPPLYCTLTLTTMRGHQNKSRLVIILYFWTKSSRLQVQQYSIDKLSQKWCLVLFICCYYDQIYLQLIDMLYA